MSEPIKIQGFRSECLHPLLKILEGFPSDRYLSIEVKDIRHPTEARKRSNQQNRYLWGVVIPMIRDRLLEQTMPPEARKALTAENVLRIVKIAAGISHLIPLFNAPPVHLEGRSSKLSTTEFMEMIEAIQAWAAQVLDISIPSPNEEEMMRWIEDQLDKTPHIRGED